MTLNEENVLLADRDAFRRRYDLGLRWVSMLPFCPIFLGGGALIQRRWSGKKHSAPLAPSATGFALRPATTVSSKGATYAADTIYWHRADLVSGGGVLTEAPLDQAQVAVWGGAGYVGLIPNTPLHVGVEQIDGPAALIRWGYNPSGEQATPASFAIYGDNATGTIDWITPIGTVNYVAGQTYYSFATGALTPGLTYLFNVRAATAGGVKSLTPDLSDSFAGSAAEVTDNVGVAIAILTTAPADPDSPVFV